jgi:hypothetical protein
MTQHATVSAFQPHLIHTLPSINMDAFAPAMVEELLPFKVKLVANEADLRKAVQIRHSAYARHVPIIAQTLIQPEVMDTADDVVVLLAESKVDGSPLGSLRIQTNQYRPLSMESSVQFPSQFKNSSLAQVSRLGIAQGIVGRLVKIILIKASFQFCASKKIDCAMVAARAPLDRQYQQLMFEDVFPGAGFIPLPHMNNEPHRIMAFDIETGQSRWTKAAHPLLKFFCNTRHPDIDIFNAVATPKAQHPSLPGRNTPSSLTH